MSDAVLVAVVLIALAFDFTNGFHDTANAVATSVSTRALSPRMAVVIASVMNFAGAFLSTAVAATIASGLVDVGVVDGRVLISGLLGAIAWNLATWYLGLPSSSSHALIGGLVGAVLAAAGADAVQWSGMWEKVVVPALSSPLIGFLLAGSIMVAILWVFRRARPGPLNRGFRVLQIGSGAAMALGHGLNDAQKTMGIIALALFTSGHSSSPDQVDDWVKLAAAGAIALGTYAGGWRIMRTMGTRIVNLEPPHGFSAQTAATGVLWVTGQVGVPISTTQVITGSVLGAGSAGRLGAVRWAVAGNIFTAWVLTLPAAAVMAALVYELAGPFL